MAFNVNRDRDIRDIIDLLNRTAILSADLGKAKTDIIELSADIVELSAASLEHAEEIAELSSDLATETETRENQVAELWARVKGGINYQGIIEIKTNGEGQLPKSLSALFTNNDYTAPFYKGYQYRVSIDEAVYPEGYSLTDDGVVIGNGDDLYFNTDVEAIEDVNDENVDIDNNVNSNIVTQPQLQLSVANINTHLESLDHSAESLSAAIAEETARALSAESELEDSISAEETRALSAEADLDEKIEAEETRALSTEADLNAAIIAESNRAALAEGELSATIDGETSRAVGAETAINDRLNAIFVKSTCEPGIDEFDTVVLTDTKLVPEGTPHDKYKLTLKNGTIVLVKII